ncbi:50S ribosomal protein L22 [Arcanobacterium phocae]|uniref:Large ribosomal subunit protein uL22 n=1 Tax=Arcanobacterium phocae TaxID=131112 RepID=A0A1H2LG60_9ACTO|nr:50S ribosomal protein L22 [Arcanobacterium phocae]SDU79396.1 large subunit ribosomal protein L22 [Arcanobacterium phocae]
MEAKAQARYVRVTPQKARRVINEIRGMRALAAVDLLKFAPQAIATDVKKILESAMANARYAAEQTNERFDDADLIVTAAYVDEGPTMKRIQPRAQGRANRILKRTSHITVIVGDEKKGA